MMLMKWIRVALTVTAVSALVTAAGCKRGSTAEPTSYAAKSTSGDVSFNLTPRGVENGHFLVDVRVDTHSGELGDLDLRDAATLQVGDRTYRPTDAVSLRGHHASGTLRFALAEAPANFAITIGGVRSMQDVTVRWP